MGGTVKKLSLTTWIFLAMVLGIIAGQVLYMQTGSASPVAAEFKLLSDIFIRLVKSIVAPLLFATLVYGIASGHGAGDMGRVGFRAVVYFEIVTTAALFVGLAFANVIQPGIGIPHEGTAAPAGIPQTKVTLAGVLEHTFPSSIIDAMAKGEVLQIVVFCFLFGTACAAIGAKAKPVVEFCESLAEVMFKYTGYVMYLAPIGVFGALVSTVGGRGLGVLIPLGKLVITVFAALIFFVVVVLGIVVFIFKIPMRRFWRAVKDPYILAFSTASSEAALPQALANMEKFGVPKHIVSFVMPLGYSLNLDGSTLYLAAASIFVAQAAGIQQTIWDQLIIMLTLMLTSKGVAAVPRASLVILTGTVAAFNLPFWPIGLILGVDAILDMARTSVNLLGNCLASAVVAKWEGYPLEEKAEETIPPEASVARAAH
jgi:proton glutamate symport protein